MKGTWVGTLAALAVLVAGQVRAQTVQAGDLTLDLTGRVQVQLNTTSVTEDDVGPGAPPTAVFETRRLYLGTAFAYGDWLTGVAQVNFGGATAALTDGYIDAALSDAVAVRMGQFKKPFGLFELTSNTKVLTIERAVRIRGLESLVGDALPPGALVPQVPGETQYLLDEGAYLGRQIGVMVHGEVGGVGYAAGVYNGEGANTADTLGTKAWAGRLTYGVGESLVVGGAVSVQPTGRFDVAGDEVMATAFAVDAEWGEFRGEGLHVMAEAMVGDNPLLLVGAEPPTMVGFQAAAAWFSPRDGRVEGLEPVLRLSWADPDTEVADNEGLLITPGVNVYFSGRNRFMVNADAYVPSSDGLDTEYSLVAQFQIYF